MAATSSEMRRLESFSSDSSVAADRVLAIHSRPGPRAGPCSTSATRSHQASVTPAAASGGAITHSQMMPWRLSHDARASS